MSSTGWEVPLGLVAASCYGASDFMGGSATRRAPVVSVLLMGQATGLVLGLLAITIDHGSELTSQALWRGAASGLVGAVGLALLYGGLARGPVGLVAPVAAVASAGMPLSWGLATGERPAPQALAGVVLAATAVAVIARSGAAGDAGERGTVGSAGLTGVIMGGVGGLGFGGIGVLLAGVDADAGMWPLVSWRVVSVTLLSAAWLVTRPPGTWGRSTTITAVSAGALDVGGNGLYLVAARTGLVSLIGSLGAMAPLATVLLARIVLGDRLKREQVAALATAFMGIVLIASNDA